MLGWIGLLFIGSVIYAAVTDDEDDNGGRNKQRRPQKGVVVCEYTFGKYVPDFKESDRFAFKWTATDIPVHQYVESLYHKAVVEMKYTGAAKVVVRSIPSSNYYVHEWFLYCGHGYYDEDFMIWVAGEIHKGYGQ